LPASYQLAKRRPGRPKGAKTQTSPIRLRDLLLSGLTANDIQLLFSKLTPKEKLDILVKLEPKEVGGVGGGPIVVKWES